jgi:hypothetical protein
MCVYQGVVTCMQAIFYRKNGRNFTRFALDCKVATTRDASRFELYSVVIRSKVEVSNTVVAF